jgi:hypothetical protein
VTELTPPTGVRALTGTTKDELDVELTLHLPPGGIAATHLEKRYRLAGVTWRLLDSRVLTAAAEILDLDVLKPLATWLARFERVRAAARRTLEEQGKPEAIETFAPPYPLTISEGVTVRIRVDERAVATIAFRLDVAMKVGETSVVVRQGAVDELVCDTLTVSATFTLVGWPTPLWKPTPVSLPDVHVLVRPPVLVPLVPEPRSDAGTPAAGAAGTRSPAGRIGRRRRRA